MADPTTPRPRPDLLVLGAGLIALLVAAWAFVADIPAMEAFDLRWVLAAGAAVMGLLLLVGSVRGRRGG